MQEKLDFMNGQCFNFAYAVCQFLKDRQIFSNLCLVSAIGTRENYEDVDQVCIHCIAKVYDTKNNQFICLDAQGSHFGNYLEKVVKIWESIEFELTGSSEEVNIAEYTFCDDRQIKSYWIDVEKTGAQRDLGIIEYAKQYIHDNIDLFQDVLVEIE